eukprot:m.1237475 g.1237475  ORF g.1237475 m.1237475 type:complete len:397 (-) comp24669_c0_seq8:3482-4672(-)
MKSLHAMALIAAISFVLSNGSTFGITNTRAHRVAVVFLSAPIIGALGLFLVRDCLLVPFNLLPSIIVAKVVPIEELRTKFISTVKERKLAARMTAERLQIPTSDSKVILDGMLIRDEGNRYKRWILWLNANGVVYEQNLEFALEYATRLQANILVFNYRGVGESTGWPSTADDLADDARSALRVLLSKYGATEENIVLHGHSMGGGTIARVVRDYPRVRRINDRSFRTLAEEVSVLLRSGLGTFMGMLLFTYVSTVVTHTARMTCSDIYEALEPYTRWMYCLVAGWAFGGSRFMPHLAAPMLDYMGWSMDAVSDWDYTRSMVIYHKNDGVIPYFGASVHHALNPNESPRAGLHAFQLSREGRPQECHMYPLNMVAHEWERLSAAIEAFVSTPVQHT